MYQKPIVKALAEVYSLAYTILQGSLLPMQYMN